MFDPSVIIEFGKVILNKEEQLKNALYITGTSYALIVVKFGGRIIPHGSRRQKAPAVCIAHSPPVPVRR